MLEPQFWITEWSTQKALHFILIFFPLILDVQTKHTHVHELYIEFEVLMC